MHCAECNRLSMFHENIQNVHFFKMHADFEPKVHSVKLDIKTPLVQRPFEVRLRERNIGKKLDKTLII